MVAWASVNHIQSGTQTMAIGVGAGEGEKG